MTASTSLIVALVGLAAAGGLAWLQWRVVRRLVGRPNEWVATSVVGAAVNAPLSASLLLDLLLRAGLPAQAALSAGLLLLGAQLALGTLGVAAVVWVLGRR